MSKVTFDLETVKRMIDEAVLAEREACAVIADEWAVGWPHPSKVIAERIRARQDHIPEPTKMVKHD
jgi:hypothetical protein